MPEPEVPKKASSPNPARDIYMAADATTQDLIKEILQQEREVQHLRRRPDIHKNILDILKRTVQ